MDYKRLWVIEVKPLKGKIGWHPVGLRYFHRRKDGKAYIKEQHWHKRTQYSYRVSKYLGPITSGVIEEV